VNVEDRTISGDHLKAMAIPLLAGRSIREEDAEAKPPRALVNRQFAEQYFPGGSIIGRHLINSITQFEIVGVIGNVRGLFIRRTALAALIGLATGGMAAFLLARLLQSQLYGMKPGHLPAYLLAGAMLMLSTVLATCMPAAKAASLNPALTIRDR